MKIKADSGIIKTILPKKGEFVVEDNMELSDTLCRSLSENTAIPVILLTVRDGAQDMVQGLSIGADDYVTKPFRMDVLVSRIRALLRRMRNRRPEDGSLYCGDVCINKKTSKVYKKDCPVELTPNEYQLLLLLLEHKNQTITVSRFLKSCGMWTAIMSMTIRLPRW